MEHSAESQLRIGDMNVLYPSAKQKMWTTGSGWVTSAYRIALYGVGASYDPAHTLLSDIAGTQISVGQDLTGKAATDGYAISDATVYLALTSAEAVYFGVIYRLGTQEVLAWLDQISNAPFFPTGDDYTLSPGGPNSSWVQL